MPRGDVLALGAVALEARQPARASEAWLAVRQRFPGSAGATEAALRLGQLASGPEGDAGTALQWYARAAREAPSGPLAAQALGGWLQAAVRAGRREEARRVAGEYVRRFRNGPDAAAAKALLQP
jgi:TolA-binding protein